MTVLLAAKAFFFDVGQFAARGELAIPADDAPATKCTKPQEPHQTHRLDPPASAGAIVVPAELGVCAMRVNESRSAGMLWNARKESRDGAHTTTCVRLRVCYRETISVAN
jgi:hypothetical protein